jgi:hypothetical protein
VSVALVVSASLVCLGASDRGPSLLDGEMNSVDRALCTMHPMCAIEMVYCLAYRLTIYKLEWQLPRALLPTAVQRKLAVAQYVVPISTVLKDVRA